MRYARTALGSASSFDLVKALVWHGARELALEDLPEPEPAADEVLLDVRLAGICGSDLHPFKGHAGPRRPPLVLGHEVVGTVEGLAGRYVALSARRLRRVRRPACAVRRTSASGARCSACTARACSRSAPRCRAAHSSRFRTRGRRRRHARGAARRLRRRPAALRADERRLAARLRLRPDRPALVARASAAGARVTAVEPLESRQALARRLGALEVAAESRREVEPGAARRRPSCRRHSRRPGGARWPACAAVEASSCSGSARTKARCRWPTSFAAV